MKLPTKAQWDEIAEAFDTPFRKRDEEQVFMTFIASRGGICDALSCINCGRHLMQGFHPTKRIWHYWWPCTDAGDRQRAFFCMLMAAITEAGDMESMIEEV